MYREGRILSRRLGGICIEKEGRLSRRLGGICIEKEGYYLEGWVVYV